jgi:hypothetical protein
MHKLRIGLLTLVGDHSQFHDTRRFLSKIVARTEDYTYDANVWALCVVQGPFSLSPPCQTLTG